MNDHFTGPGSDPPANTVGERLRRVRHSTFVGRQTEIDEFLREAVQPAVPLRNVFVYYGVGGIGKSSLLHELEGLAAAERRIVCSAVADRVGSPLELMRTWREHLPEKHFRKFDNQVRGYSEVAAKLQSTSPLVQGTVKAAEAAAGPIGAFVSGMIGEERLRTFLSAVLSGREMTKYLEGARLITQEFLAGLERTARDRRVFLFLDYYEVTTAETDRWLREALIENMSTTFVVVLAGREPIHTNPLWADYARIIRHRELRPLSEPEIGVYLDRVGIHDTRVRADLMSFTGGHPWALELTAEAVIESSGDPEEELPGLGYVRTRVVQRFLRELDGKATHLRQIVEIAAILTRFDEDILGHLLGADVGAELREIVRYSFLTLSDDGKYALKDMVREVMEEDFRARSGERWRDAHARAADYYQRVNSRCEAMSAEWRQSFHEWLYHVAAIDSPRALDLFTETVRHFPVQVWAPQCSATFEVIEANPQTTTDPRVRFYRGQLAYVGNDAGTAHTALIEVATSPDCDPGLRLSAYAGVLDLEHRQGHIVNALEHALAAYGVARQADDSAYTALFAARVAEMYGVSGDRAKVLEYSAIAREFLSSVTDDLMAGHVSLLLTYTTLFMGDFTLGRQDVERCLGRWVNAGYEFGVALARNSMAWLGWLTGRFAEGLAHAEQAHDYFGLAGDVYHQGLVALNLAELHRRKKNAAASISWNQRAIGCLSGSNGELYQAIATYRLGRTHLDIGEPHVAIPLLERALEMEESVGEAYSAGLCLLYLAEAYVSVGDPRARETIRRAEENLVDSHNRYGQVLGRLGGATLRRELDPSLDTRRPLEECAAEARRHQFHDLEAIALMKLAIESSERDPLVGFGPILGESLRAACLYSPYLADDIFAQCGHQLASYPPSERREHERVICQILQTPDEVLTADGRRRVAEQDERLGAPLADRLDFQSLG